MPPLVPVRVRRIGSTRMKLLEPPLLPGFVLTKLVFDSGLKLFDGLRIPAALRAFHSAGYSPMAHSLALLPFCPVLQPVQFEGGFCAVRRKFSGSRYWVRAGSINSAGGDGNPGLTRGVGGQWLHPEEGEHAHNQEQLSSHFSLPSNPLLPLDNRLRIPAPQEPQPQPRTCRHQFMDFSTIEMPRCRVTRHQPSNQEVRPELAQEREQEGITARLRFGDPSGTDDFH